MLEFDPHPGGQIWDRNPPIWCPYSFFVGFFIDLVLWNLYLRIKLDWYFAHLSLSLIFDPLFCDFSLFDPQFWNSIYNGAGTVFTTAFVLDSQSCSNWLPRHFLWSRMWQIWHQFILFDPIWPHLTPKFKKNMWVLYLHKLSALTVNFELFLSNLGVFFWSTFK